MHPSTRKTTAMIAFGALTGTTAGLGALASRPSGSAWFRALDKPPFQPPDWVFGPVWSVLYGMIAASGYRTWRAPRSAHRSRALALWGIQLGLNGLWSPIFFGKKAPVAALVDVSFLLGTTAGYVSAARKADRTAAWLAAPYLGWVAFATVLNAEIVRRNRLLP